jgi:hypothetical protein
VASSKTGSKQQLQIGQLEDPFKHLAVQVGGCVGGWVGGCPVPVSWIPAQTVPCVCPPAASAAAVQVGIKRSDLGDMAAACERLADEGLVLLGPSHRGVQGMYRSIALKVRHSPAVWLTSYLPACPRTHCCWLCFAVTCLPPSCCQSVRAKVEVTVLCPLPSLLSSLSPGVGGGDHVGPASGEGCSAHQGNDGGPAQLTRRQLAGAPRA